MHITECENLYALGLDVVSGSSVYVEGVAFERNLAIRDGGSVSVYESSPVFNRVQFIDNIAYYYGGAVDLNNGGDATFEECVFEGSLAGSFGGAIFIGFEAKPEFSNCQFISNQGQRGGAIYCVETATTISGCTFYDNHAEFSGGAIHFDYEPNQGQSVMSSSLVYGNHGVYGGGGVVVTNGANPLLINLTVVGNYGDTTNGSGVSSFTNAHPTIENSIIANNIGPGIIVDGTADLSIFCSDVFGNTEGNYLGNIFDQTGLNGNISEEPHFCDYDNWVLSLAEQSPCLPENNDCGLLMGALGMDCTLTGAEEVPILGIQLLPCFPNPFNPHTTISLQLDNRAALHVSIHDVLGRKVKTLQEGWLEAGSHEFHWRGLNEAGVEATSGVYFVVLDGPNGRISQKIALLR